MKKLLLTVFLFCSILTVSAQKSFRLGVTGGMNVAKITDIESDARMGFNLGARFEYNFLKNAYFGTGLIFTQKGYKDEYSEEGAKVEEKGNPVYLQIPIQIGGRLHLTKGLSLFGETGPYLAFGVGGKVKGSASIDNVNVSEKTDFFGNDLGNVCDFGWALRAGVEIRKIQVHLGYDYGFTKVVSNTSTHNSNFSIGLSYFF